MYFEYEIRDIYSIRIFTIHCSLNLSWMKLQEI